MKTKVTVDWAKAQANELLVAYSHLTNAQDIINQAIADGKYEDKNQVLAIWGRLMRHFR
jgi:DNA transposition AAA+ family ATPase